MSWVIILRLFLGIADSIVGILRDRQLIDNAQAVVIKENLSDVLGIIKNAGEVDAVWYSLSDDAKLRLAEKYKNNS